MTPDPDPRPQATYPGLEDLEVWLAGRGWLIKSILHTQLMTPDPDPRPLATYLGLEDPGTHKNGIGVV